MINDIFVEKKENFAVESKHLCKDIKENLKIDKLKNIRTLNRYIVKGLNNEEMELIKNEVLSEPAVDIVYMNELPDQIRQKKENAFFIELLAGQYDQRADWAMQCIKSILPNKDVKVKTGKVIFLEGDVSKIDIDKIKKYLINPIETHEACIEKPNNIDNIENEPEHEKYINDFRKLDSEGIQELINDYKLAMNEKDLEVIQKYFLGEDREPTVTELKVLDTYWSDHCRHTTFNAELENIDFDNSKYGKVVKAAFGEYLEIRKEVYGNRALLNSKLGGKAISLMDIACIGSKYLQKKGVVKDLDISDEVNACSIKVKAEIDGKTQDWIVMFKNETHNHPTEIEPFGGAATCLGGAIRDPLSGRSYVYQAMRVTGSGDPRKSIENTLNGKLMQKTITQKAAHGYSSYGNQIGIATGLVDEIYHEGYIAKRMEVGAVIGAAPSENVVREKPQKGDLIILLGGKTGRDGCGGATGSSKKHDVNSLETCSAEVQKGNPPVERNIQRFFRKKEVSTLIKKCNDFGAGGVSVAVGELADSIDVHLDVIPKKYQGLSGTELAISESQERMAVVIDEKNTEKFLKMAAAENLEATVIAEVTETGRFRIETKGEYILDLKRDFLESAGAIASQNIIVEEQKYLNEENEEFTYEKAMSILSDLNNCSKKGLIEMFDSSIGAATVLAPLGGKYQLSPTQGMVAKLPVLNGETSTCTIMTYGYDPYISEKSPFEGAFKAVIDSVTKIAAIGGNYSRVRLSFQEYFGKLTDEKSWGKPFESLLGALMAQKELGIPAIGGKDSMSGTFGNINVPPALISFAVAPEDASNIITPELKGTNNKLLLINSYNDSELNMYLYRKNMEKVQELIKEKQILSAYAVGKGGVFASLFKMAVGNKIGYVLKNIEDHDISKEYYGNIVIEVSESISENIAKENSWKEIGKTIEKTIIVEKSNGDSVVMDIEECLKCWQEPLEKIFPTEETDDLAKVEISYTQKKYKNYEKTKKISIAKPKIIIPVFPGTNCEIDTGRAFEKAGGKVEYQIIRNLSTVDLEDSINELVKKINNAQIICLPGGFSAGDEPDGSAKFITAILKNEKLKEAIKMHIEQKDGLMLGICNGFQALIKLGLVPFGEIVTMKGESPTLTYNNIGRHQAKIVNTKVISNLSPWLSKCKEGDIHAVPISHGEGRFVASDEVAKELFENGQVATQYVDETGKLSNLSRVNPNGSCFNIESITSKDGRILGKMAHSERVGKNVHKNIYGEKEQQIFRAGIEYFL